MRKLYACFLQLLLIVLLCFFTVGLFGQTAIFVSPSGNDNSSGNSWSNAKKTLSGALGTVSGTTHIYMKVGIYTCANVIIPNGVTVTGGYASTSSGTDTTLRLFPGTNANWTHGTLCTILEGNNAARIATVNTGGKLEGCVVTHGATSGKGGGVLIDGGTVQHCAIIYNSVFDDAGHIGKGGGAYVQNNGYLLNCVVAFNTASNGPGVAGTDGTLTNNTITYNYANNCGNVTDYDGNVYNAVRIGEQCWMKENLRTTHYANGESIALGGMTSTTTPYRYYPNDNSGNVASYGYLYNWKAVMGNSSSSNSNPSGVQGVCPNGWHVPSDAEWIQLTDYVSSQEAYICDNSSANIAKALAATTTWNTGSTSCAVGNTPSDNNATGFSALPAGGYNGGFYSSGTYAYFWSSTEASSTVAYYRYCSYNSATVNRNSDNKYYGRSVRCVRNGGNIAATKPTVTTSELTGIMQNAASCGGNVTSDGGSAVTVRGICWSTSPHPTVNDSHTADGSGTGSFTSDLTGLASNTMYYVRAYATNYVGTAYGEEYSFTTLSDPCQGETTVADIDGNVYNTVSIGNQCWMKENLRTTKYANGTVIASGSGTSTTVAYYYSLSSGDFNNGKLYNWKAVMGGASTSAFNPSGVQGICPNGWHVPSDAEWNQLTDYVSSVSQYRCSGNAENIAKALAATTTWNTNSTSCAVGNTPSDNNATGFSALPAGGFFVSGYGSSGSRAYFWSATEASGSTAYHRYLYSNDATVYRGSDQKYIGYSVRCVRNSGDISATEPTVTTSEVTEIMGTAASCGGSVTSDGGSPVTASGVCWSTSPNPTISDSHTVDGNSSGSFTSSITGLSSNTTYYVRAYATNNVGTAYGDEYSFTTLSDPCQGVTTITDIDGNVYNTLSIGNQCWMKENLRTTKYADGTVIASGSGTSTTVAYYYSLSSGNFNNGKLYNWKAVMRDATTSAFNPSGVQGICPNGWHVPSDAEWNQLTDYVSSQSQYWCSNSSENIAKALASTSGWNSSSNTCAVGKTQSNNNATGFSALPAGKYYSSGYNNSGDVAYFWSATEASGSTAYHRYLNYTGATVYRGSDNKYTGYSVRCVRD